MTTSKTVQPKSLQDRRQRAQKIITILKKIFPDASIVLNYSNPWELLVAVILSAQCTDKTVNKVTAILFKKYRTLDDYIRVNPQQFAKDIKSTGFYHNKAKNILAAAKIIRKQYEGTIPSTMAQMIELPGVGRKTANVVLGNAYGIIEGIAVDTHVRRLAHRLDLTDHHDPKKIERDLMKIVHKEEWFKLTYLLIEYGRKYCTAKRHNHAACPLRKFDRKLR